MTVVVFVQLCFINKYNREIVPYMYTMNPRTKIIEEAGITNYKRVSLITEYVLMPFVRVTHSERETDRGDKESEKNRYYNCHRDTELSVLSSHLTPIC